MPLDVVWWLRRKLDLEEWLFKLVQSVYSNQRIRVSFCVAPPLPLHIFSTPLYPSKQIPCPLPRHLKTKLLPVKTNSPFKKKLPLISVLIHKTTLEQVASYSAKMAVLTWSMQNFKRKMKLSKNILLSYDKLIKQECIDKIFTCSPHLLAQPLDIPALISPPAPNKKKCFFFKILSMFATSSMQSDKVKISRRTLLC